MLGWAEQGEGRRGGEYIRSFIQILYKRTQGGAVGAGRGTLNDEGGWAEAKGWIQ